MAKFVRFVLVGGAIVALVGLILGILISYPRVQSVLSNLIAERGARITRDAPYGPHDRQRLDVYEPREDQSSSPVVLFIQGGNWRYGSREIYAFLGAALAARGITTVIPDYRLYPEVKFPAFVEDAALAYRWVADNLIRSGERRPIILAGHSAGAHIAALLAYDRRYRARAAPDAPRPTGFIGLAGPYAFDPTTWPSTRDVFSTATTADEARPAAFVSPDAPPSLLFHGTDDTVVKLWNMRALAAALTEHGVPVRAVELDRIGHLGVVLAIARPLRWRAPVLGDMIAFIASLKPAATAQGLVATSPSSPSRE